MARMNTSSHRVRVKHVPQRTCLACRKVKPKQELVRLVRLTDGTIEIDPDGKKAGRGAYLCGLPECWDIGLKGGRLERALRTVITVTNRKQLAEYFKDTLRGVS